ncbi:monocarboxylate transporter 12-like [Apostichopus japonicus]|uniref:monocarboxylate transporter 12-like n=1 Tax=Stichopus japonicus TaxID=307972 RepID=UPI003AB6A92E
MTTTLYLMKVRWSWIVSIAAFLISGGVLSPMNCYTWLFTSLQSEINATAVQSGWIGSTVLSTNFLAGPLAVIVESYLGYRLTTILGSILASSFMLLASYMNSYGGLLLFYGVGYGITSCFVMHATLCVLMKHFSKSNRSKASAVVYVGASVGTSLLAMLYEKLIPLGGWRLTLRVSSVIVFLLAVPNSCVMYSKEEIERKQSVSLKVDETLHMEMKNRDRIEKSVVSSISDKIDTKHGDSALHACEDETRGTNTWLRLFTSLNPLLLLIALFLLGIAWTAYWVNIISYFESLLMNESAILLNATVANVSEVLGRMFLLLFVGKLPLREVNLLILMSLFSTVVTLAFVLTPTEPVILCCCVFIGIGRGWSIILPYAAATDLLKGHTMDQAVTLVMIAHGLGFLFGTLPPGLIYDATNSYAYAFIINSILYMIGAALLVLLQVRRRCSKVKNIQRRRRRRRQSETENKIRKTGSDWSGSINHGYDNR